MHLDSIPLELTILLFAHVRLDEVVWVLYGRRYVDLFLSCEVSTEGQYIVFVLSPCISRAIFIHSEAHVLERINLHDPGVALPADLLNQRRHLSILPLRLLLPSQAELPEVVLAPTVNSPVAVEGQHVGAAARDAYQERWEEAFDFAQLRGVAAAVDFRSRRRVSAQTEGETSPRE